MPQAQPAVNATNESPRSSKSNDVRNERRGENRNALPNYTRRTRTNSVYNLSAETGIYGTDDVTGPPKHDNIEKNALQGENVQVIAKGARSIPETMILNQTQSMFHTMQSR